MIKKLSLILSLFISVSSYAQTSNNAEFAQLLRLVESVDFSDPSNQKRFFDQIFMINEQGQLQEGIEAVVSKSGLANKNPAFSTEIYKYINAEFYARGYMNGIQFPDWNQIAINQFNIINTFPKISSFRSPQFASIFKKLSGNNLVNSDSLRIIPSGDDSYHTRLNLIKSAKKSIYLMTWGFHDDSVGRTFSSELIKAKRRGIKIKLIVDAQTASKPHYDRELLKLKRNGIEVVYWSSRSNPYYGLHVKMMIIDEVKVIEGGRNIGENYLLRGKWEDLDIYYEGCLANSQALQVFVSFWNEQVSRNRNYNKIHSSNSADCSSGNYGSLVHYPGSNFFDPIYALSLYSFENAKREINIANAYVINTPAVEWALARALDRGVRVNIYTNSSESVDEPIVSYPIMKSVEVLARAGANVFLKKGQTLHSKYLIVDDMAWVGSYNLHPRSFLYEVEKVIVSTDPIFVRNLKNEFQKSISQAFLIRGRSNFVVPRNEIVEKFLPLFFNQL